MTLLLIAVGLGFFGLERAAAYFLRDRVESATYVSIRAFCGVIAIALLFAGASQLTMDERPAMPTTDVRTPR